MSLGSTYDDGLLDGVMSSDLFAVMLGVPVVWACIFLGGAR
jgi:hypothetical protein